MASIGIIANPASGKDIRRLVSHATVIDNNEKINIVERIVLGAQALGVKKVFVMPDSYNMGYRVEDKLKSCNELKCEINIVNMLRFDGMEDTVKAADYMEKNNEIRCIITLGGDGTNRAAARSIKNTPLITISTGTNNVYPTMLEGTVAGMAAAAVASGRFDDSKFVTKDKRIEIYRDDELIDIALIDAVISNPNSTSFSCMSIFFINCFDLPNRRFFSFDFINSSMVSIISSVNLILVLLLVSYLGADTISETRFKVLLLGVLLSLANSSTFSHLVS